MDSSSSDGSFAWTDASSDTLESTTMIDDKKNEIYSDNESVSGKTYKKKLQDELFARSNGDVEKPDEGHKRKRKLTEHSSSTEQASPKKKKIKREPESDVDISTNKNKNGISTESYDESYLDFKVKAEVQFTPPSLTKAKKKKSKNNNSNIQTTNEEFEKFKREESEAEEKKLDELVQQEIDQHEKKKKKKKKKTKRRHDSDVNSEANHTDSQIEVDDAAINSFQQFTEESDVTVSEKVASVKHKKKSKHHSRDEEGDSTSKPAPEAHKPSIPERIQFEDDDSSDNQTSQLQSSETPAKSSNVKKFLKNNLNLKPSTSLLTAESALTADDEIWLLRCPKEVDIHSFKNKDITLEGKCKLKLNNQTYEGTVDTEMMNLSILSSDRSNFVIKSLPVTGCLNLRKRIPKNHILDELLVSNPSNFIPLPETKCRHPLFGVNYRKAIKLPSGVAQRLRAAPATPGGSSHATPKPEPAPSADSDHPVSTKKKLKKRKHSNSEEVAPKKKKKSKHDLESAEAWESEQAIEENLFNF